MLDILNELGLILQIIGFYLLITSLLYTYKFFTTKDTVKTWYKKKLRNSLLVLIIGGIIIFIILNFIRSSIGISQGGGIPVPVVPGSSGASVPTVYTAQARNTGVVSSGLGLLSTYYHETNYPTQTTNSNISDSREYIKQTYSASIKTRAVEEVAKKIELLIRGVGGRIDSSNVSEEVAYFSFVIPKKELDGFESQIRTYIPKKFYTQTISSQNLLGDKQALEQKQDTNTQTISTLAKQKKDVEDSYTKSSSAVKAELTTKQIALNKLTVDIARKEGEINATTNPQNKALLQTELNDLIEEEGTVTGQITQLNNTLSILTSTFNSQMTNLGVSLTEQTSLLASLDKQEDTFFDNVETVRGSISIQYISLWRVLKLYSPVDPIIIVGIILFLLSLYSTHKKEKALLGA